MKRELTDPVSIQMKLDFIVTMLHFHVAEDVAEFAWKDAMENHEHASTCYRAIAGSLEAR
jgi:hypothetical protein